MELIKNQEFGGERPLFAIEDTRLEGITVTDGESAIKHCRNVEADNCRFYGKYPWWHVDGALVTNCYFAPESRSAIWYTNDMVMRDCVIDGPKFFREMKNLTLENVVINDADETFWRVDGLKLKKRENRDEGLLLGMRERDHLRLRDRWRVHSMALEERQVGELSSGRRADTLLCR